MVLYKCKEKLVLPPQGGRKENIMALKTAWQRRQEAAGEREYKRGEWISWKDKRKVQLRKALYVEGYKVNYPFSKR